MVTKRLAILIAILGILTLGIARAEEAGARKAAAAAAKAWLKLVDEGKYSQSWTEAARYFQTAVRPETWEESLRALREPLGGVVSRKLISQQYSTALPGAPDGEYVVLQFETSFSNKRSAVETVTPMKDRDGVWRVSGYYVK